jgi:hypothetical protein
MINTHASFPSCCAERRKEPSRKDSLVRLRRVQLDGTLQCKCALVSVLGWSVWSMHTCPKIDAMLTVSSDSEPPQRAQAGRGRRARSVLELN